MKRGFLYRCDCGTLYDEYRGPNGCPACGSRQRRPARLESASETGLDVDLEDLNPQPGSRFPTKDGHYVVWLVGQLYPITLPWSLRSSGWRRGAMLVEVRAWIGPLPKVDHR